MRKVLIVLLLMLLPCAARAEAAYDWDLIPGYAMLNDTQRTLFGAAYAAALRGETGVPVPDHMAYDEATEAMDLLIAECPELCALDDCYRITYARSQPEVAEWVELTYARPLETQTILLDAAKTMAAQAEGSAWERELILHDMLCNAATYDLNAPSQSTSYGALVDGRAGCSGYARALTLLCRLAGIPCQTVSGTAKTGGTEERHTWCVLYIGGAFAQTDPTWNDQDRAGLITHWYFNLTDAQIAADHSPDADTLALPCTDGSLSWHARNGLVVPADAEKARAIIDEAMENMVRRGETVNLRFEQAEAAEAFAHDVGAWIEAYNLPHPEAPYEGSWSAFSLAAQGCVIVVPEL